MIFGLRPLGFVMHFMPDRVVSLLVGGAGVSPWAGQCEQPWPGQAGGGCVCAVTLLSLREAQEELIEDQRNHCSVSLETGIAGGSPGGAFLLVFNSPFSEFHRLCMKKIWWQKQS